MSRQHPPVYYAAIQNGKLCKWLVNKCLTLLTLQKYENYF